MLKDEIEKTLPKESAHYYTDKLVSLFEKYAEELIGELFDYTQHEKDCILSKWSAGQNTKDGGYEMKFDDKWYQSKPIDKTPKCDCGLSDLKLKLSSLVEGK